MAGSGKKWLLGCGLGCGIPVLVVVVVTIVGGVRMMKPFEGAVTAQTELTTAYGAREDYVPPADGPSPERLEKFLQVRQALAPLCAEFAEIGRKFDQMEEIDEQEAPSRSEVFKAVGGLTSAVFGFAGNIGLFTQTRNEALLAAEMGLGEYIWIYVLAYNSLLDHVPNQDFESKGGTYEGSSQRVIRRLVENHAGALAAAGQVAEAAAWRAELDRLDRTEGSGVPWEKGALPLAMAERLEPYRDRLEDLYCPETSAFELGQIRKKGLSITSN